MRRKDREVTNPEEIMDIIQKCDLCRLAYVDDGMPYVIPMFYGYTFIDNTLTLYFHCANEGRQINIIKKNPSVCFEIDCVNIHVANQNGYQLMLESVVGNGIISFVTDRKDKKSAIATIIKRHSYIHSQYATKLLTDKRIDGVTILKVVVNEFSGKRYLRHDYNQV